MAALFVVHFNLDPVGPSLLKLLSNTNTNHLHNFLLPFRYSIMLSSVLEAFRTGITYISSCIVMMITLNNSISRISQLVLNPLQVSWKGFTVTPVALKTIKIYKMIQLYLNITEPIYSTVMPVMIFCGSLLVVVCNFSTVKFYGKVEFYLYICAPGWSIIEILIVLTLLPQANNIFEKCQAYRAALKFAMKSKMEKTVLKSLKPFGMSATFFTMKSSLRTKMVEYQMYYTMTLLISLKS